MNITERLLQDEGFDNQEGGMHFVYPDSKGYLTIDPGILVDHRRGGGLYDEECRFILSNRLGKIRTALDREIPWWTSLPIGTQDVLQDMAYQLGIEGLMEFHHFLAALHAEDWNRAQEEMMDSLWARETPERAVRLMQMVGT